VWTLRYIETNCTATIWKNDFGLELSVERGGELIESRLSPYGIEQLLLITDQIKRIRSPRMVRFTERDTLMYRVVPATARRTRHSNEPSRADIDHLLRIRRNDSRLDDEQVRIA